MKIPTKRLTAALAALMMCISCTACGDKQTDDIQTDTSEVVTSAAKTESSETAATASDFFDNEDYDPLSDDYDPYGGGGAATVAETSFRLDTENKTEEGSKAVSVSETENKQSDKTETVAETSKSSDKAVSKSQSEGTDAQLTISVPNGWNDGTADYSQIELRVLAALSGDEHMKDAFLKDEDIHTRTAAQVFAVRQDEVTHEMRSSAKAVNFGIVYGISDFGLAKQLGIPRFKAAEYIEKYLSEFSGVREYMHNAVEQAKKDGYARTLFGRLRYIDELSSSNYNVRSFGERAAMNTPVQGTAADIIKKAMNEVYLRIKNQGLKAKLILQVHDELIVDTPADEVEQVKNVLSDVMQNICPELGVPLSVSVASGRTWAQAK